MAKKASLDFLFGQLKGEFVKTVRGLLPQPVSKEFAMKFRSQCKFLITNMKYWQEVLFKFKGF